MEFLKKKIKQIRPLFEEGGKYEKFYFLYEAHETLFFQPKHTAGAKGAHMRDAIDLKRLMTTVIIALVPCLLFGIWNTGHQHFLAIGEEVDLMAKLVFGAKLVLPILAVSYAVGLGVEFIFATVNRHSVAEGFLVSGMLIPLIVPATIPLWQVALATAFSVVIGKEIFGGTGMNILNPALTARAFLFFAYPRQMAGTIWTDLGDKIAVDGYTGATVLDLAANGGAEAVSAQYSFADMFFGYIPGSIGETSALACLIGAVILLGTGVASWRIMLSMLLGGLAMSGLAEAMGVNYFGSENFYYHLAAGGFAFGLVFMATDPVSAAHTDTGKWIYGFFAGSIAILVRIVNPAYPEGVMLAILLANVLAPLFDYFVVEANKKRRLNRATV